MEFAAVNESEAERATGQSKVTAEFSPKPTPSRAHTLQNFMRGLTWSDTTKTVPERKFPQARDVCQLLGQCRLTGVPSGAEEFPNCSQPGITLISPEDVGEYFYYSFIILFFYILIFF
jgi:hypothetical protein